MGASGQIKPAAALPPVQKPVPTEEEAEWALQPVRIFRRRETTTAPAAIRTPDRPVHGLVTIPTEISRIL